MATTRWAAGKRLVASLTIQQRSVSAGNMPSKNQHIACKEYIHFVFTNRLDSGSPYPEPSAQVFPRADDALELQ